MSEAIDTKNNRDFLVEAVSICEAKSNMRPEIRHLKALYNAWGAQINIMQKTRNAVMNLSRMSREGQKLPTPQELPLLMNMLTKDVK